MARPYVNGFTIVGVFILAGLSLPVVLMLAIFVAPIVLFMAPLLVAWSIAQGGAGRPSMPSLLAHRGHRHAQPHSA